MPKQARTGALMDVPKGVQRCAMPPTQAQTGAPRSAWGLQTPTDAVPGAMPPTQVQTGAPSTGHRNAKAPALPDGRRRKRYREAQPNTRAPAPWTQNRTDARYRAETSERNWKQVQRAFLDDGRAAAPNPQRNQRTDGAEHLLDARPSSAAPWPRDTPRLAARQPSAPKQHASEAPPFAAPQSDAYCCYRCSSCAHYTTRHAAPPLTNAKKLHVVEKMPPNSKL